jgi:transposase-like protein
LYRVIDRDVNLIDTMLSASQDMAAAQRFFRSAKATVTGGSGTQRRLFNYQLLE